MKNNPIFTSSMNAEQYRLILTSKYFKTHGGNLRAQIAKFARIIATRYINPEYLEAYTSCRLIPLDKNPGIRPIGIGEVLRRIVGKSISWALKSDIQEAAGPLQVASGLKSGAEAAIHFMREAFQNDESDAVILVDAENAFNSLNRSVLLHNIQVLCPAFSTIAINTYRTPSRLILPGGDEIHSCEGTTQGDPLAMPLYSIGTAPIISHLERQRMVKQIWLADDATSTGKLSDLRKWWDEIVWEGRKYGYHVNNNKSWLIVKNTELLDEARVLFGETNINVTKEGKRHLGAVLGSSSYRAQYITELIQEWVHDLSKLSDFAKSQPQAAYAAFTHGFQHKLTYFMRTLPEMSQSLVEVDEVITNKLIPTIIGTPISATERQLFSLPVKYGGLGIPVFNEIAEGELEASLSVKKSLVEIMHTQSIQIRILMP